MSTKQNQPLSASELATIITGAIVDKFVSIGLVAVNTHPSSVPPAASTSRAARVTHTAAPDVQVTPRLQAYADAHSGIHAGMEYITKETHPDIPRAQRKAFNQALFRVKRDTAKSDAPAKVTHKAAPAARQESAPRVRSTDNPVVTVSEHYRTKLPKSLFDAPEGQVYAHATFYTPDGREFVKKSDTEGRAWCVSEWLGQTGQSIEFLPVEPSVWQMSVMGQASTPATRTVTRAARPSAQVTRALEEAFAAPTPAKPARSAKQLANDAKLREAAQARRVNASKAEASGVVAAGTRAEARAAHVTPRHVVSMPSNLSAARTRAVNQVAALTSTRNANTGEIGSTIDLGRIVARVIKGGGNR